jgi:hypothetical protein
VPFKRSQIRFLLQRIYAAFNLRIVRGLTTAFKIRVPGVHETDTCIRVIAESDRKEGAASDLGLSIGESYKTNFNQRIEPY